MSFIIAVDSNCDLPFDFIDRHDLYLFKLSALLDGEEFFDDLGKSYSHHEFYDKLRDGAMPTTSQVNTFTFEEQFRIWASNGLSIVYIAFSSALSGTYNSAMTAKENILVDFPDAKIEIIDTRCASGGAGLVVKHAVSLRGQEVPFDKLVTELRSFSDTVVHVFTVDDLFHLERGGRVSITSAFVGSLLKIKPVLYVNPKGELIPFAKHRGRKKALLALVDEFSKLCIDKTLPVQITHGDCKEDAEYVGNKLLELGVPKVEYSLIGPAIGSHSGANTVALFFIGKNKNIHN